jgi:hypothetical protein
VGIGPGDARYRVRCGVRCGVRRAGVSGIQVRSRDSNGACRTLAGGGSTNTSHSKQTILNQTCGRDTTLPDANTGAADVRRVCTTSHQCTLRHQHRRRRWLVVACRYREGPRELSANWRAGASIDRPPICPGAPAASCAVWSSQLRHQHAAVLTEGCPRKPALQSQTASKSSACNLYARARRSSDCYRQSRYGTNIFQRTNGRAGRQRQPARPARSQECSAAGSQVREPSQIPAVQGVATLKFITDAFAQKEIFAVEYRVREVEAPSLCVRWRRFCPRECR